MIVANDGKWVHIQTCTLSYHPHSERLRPFWRSLIAWATTSSLVTVCLNTPDGTASPPLPGMKSVETHPGETSNTLIPFPSSSLLRPLQKDLTKALVAEYTLSDLSGR